METCWWLLAAVGEAGLGGGDHSLAYGGTPPCRPVHHDLAPLNSELTMRDKAQVSVVHLHAVFYDHSDNHKI